MNTATVEREKLEVLGQDAKVLVMRRPVAVPELFGSVLLETSGEEKKRREVAAAISMSLQCLVLGVAVLIPLWFTDSLPKQEFFTMLVAPPPPPPPPAAPAARVVQRAVTEMVGGQLHVPVRIPDRVQMVREEEPAPTSGVVGGIPGGVPGGQLGGVIGGILSSAANVSAVPKLATFGPQRIRVSQG